MAGVLKYEEPVGVFIETTPELLFTGNANRSYLKVLNHGSKKVYLFPERAQVGDELGVMIPAQGYWEPLQIPTNSFWAMSENGSQYVEIIQAVQK